MLNSLSFPLKYCSTSIAVLRFAGSILWHISLALNTASSFSSTESKSFLSTWTLPSLTAAIASLLCLYWVSISGDPVTSCHNIFPREYTSIFSVRGPSLYSSGERNCIPKWQRTLLETWKLKVFQLKTVYFMKKYNTYSTGRAFNVERACFLLDFVPLNKSSSVEVIQLHVNK